MNEEKPAAESDDATNIQRPASIFSILEKEETKIKVNVHSGSGDTFSLLETKASSIHADIIKFFVSSTKKYKHASLLHQLCSDPRNTLSVKSLIETGIIDVNIVDKNRKTPLHVAVSENCEEIVKLLLHDRRIKVNECDHLEKTPLHYSYSNRTLLAILLEHNEVSVMHQDIYGKTILHYYCKNRSQPCTDIVEMILKKCGKNKEILSMRDKDGNLPVDHAHPKQRGCILSVLHNLGNDCYENVEGHQKSPVGQLFEAITNGKVDAVEEIVTHNFKDTDLSNYKYREQIQEALHLSLSSYRKSKASYFKIIKCLLSVFPDLCFGKNRDGKTPLHIACGKKFHDLVPVILEVPNINLHEKCNNGMTAIQYAIKGKNMTCFNLLLEKLNISHKDDDGKSILHHCFKDARDKKTFVSMFTKISEKEGYHPKSLMEKDKENLSPLQYTKEQKDWSSLLEIGKSLLGKALSVDRLGRTHIQKLANKLDSKYYKFEPLWLMLCRALRDNEEYGYEMTDLQMQAISGDYNYQLGRNVVEVMKTRLDSVKNVLSIARDKEHMLIVDLLKGFPDKNISELDENLLNNLAIHIGSDVIRVRDELYEKLKFPEDTVESIENRHTDGWKNSPTVVFIAGLKTSKPTFEIRLMLKELNILKLENVVNLLGEIAFDIIVKYIETVQ